MYIMNHFYYNCTVFFIMHYIITDFDTIFSDILFFSQFAAISLMCDENDEGEIKQYWNTGLSAA